VFAPGNAPVVDGLLLNISGDMLRFNYKQYRHFFHNKQGDCNNTISSSRTHTLNNPHHTTPHTTTVLQPFFRDHPGETVPEENFWTLWCKGRLTEAQTLTIWLGATPSGLTSAHLYQTPHFFTGRMPFLPTNQQCQSTENN